MPAEDRRARQLLEDLKAAGTQDILVVLVAVPGPEYLDDGKMLLDTLVGQLVSFPSIGDLEVRFSSQQQGFFADIFLPNAALYLSEKERDDLLGLLSDTGIRRKVQENKRLLQLPLQGGMGEMIIRDPLGLSTLWLSKWLNLQTFSGLELSDGYLVDKDHRHLLVFVRPREPARNIGYTQQLMAAAQDAAQTALKAWRQDHPAALDAPSIAFAGGYAIAAEDAAITRSDLQNNILLSLLGVNLLFLLVYRNPRFLLFIQIPLAMGITWTFGTLYLIFGHVNMLTGAFAGVQLAMGIDFAIYFLNLYLGACQAGQDHATALRTALTKGGHSTLVGGVTTAVAFLALGVSSFRGFKELGIITCIGMCACIVAMMVVLPAMLMFWQRRQGQPSGDSSRIPEFGIAPLAVAVSRRPRRMVLASLVVLAVLGAAAFRVSFDDDMRSLRPQNSRSLALENEIQALLGGTSHNLLVVMEGGNDEELLNRARRLNEALDVLQSRARLSHYRSVLSFLPASESQQENLDFLRQHAAELDPDRIAATFRQALDAEGFRFLPEYESYLHWLRSLVQSATALKRQDLEASNAGVVLTPFLVRHGSSWRLFTYVFPRSGLWLKADLEQLTSDIEQAALAAGISAGQWRLAGLPVLVEYLKSLVMVDLRNTLMVSLVATAAVLFLGFRNMVLVLLAFVPLLAGMLNMIGIMALISLRFNYANFIALPIIVGIGIDYGVHMVSRWREEPESYQEAGFRETGRAIVMSALTTLVGFGSLLGSSYPGLRSIDWVMALGVINCVLASLITLPALLTWMGANAGWVVRFSVSNGSR